MKSRSEGEHAPAGLGQVFMILNRGLLMCMRNGKYLSFSARYSTSHEAGQAVQNLQSMGYDAKTGGDEQSVLLSATFPRAEIDELADKFVVIPKEDSTGQDPIIDARD
jgi:hypothetical protein